MTYELGFGKQAPLYSWILKTLSYIFPLGIYLLTFTKYLLTFLFYWGFYSSCRRLWDRDWSFMMTVSLLLFISYSYDFNRDLTHTVLVTTVSVWAYFIYLRLLEEPKSINYVYLGLAFALGFLAKYNFVFLVGALVLASLHTKASRRVLFNTKSFLSMVTCALLIAHHVYWVYEHKMSAVQYALARGSDTAQSVSFFGSTVSVFLAYYEIFLVLGILYLLFVYRPFSRGVSRSPVDLSRNRSESGLRARGGGVYSGVNEQVEGESAIGNFVTALVFWIAVYAMSLPLLTMMVFGMEKFYAKWLCPVAFTVVPAFFVGINSGESALRRSRKIIYFLVILVILLELVIVSLGAFKPGLIGKIPKTQYPYPELLRQISDFARNKNFDKVVLLTSADPVLLANMQLELKKQKSSIQILRLRELAQRTDLQQYHKIYIWSAQRNPETPKLFLEALTGEIDQGVFRARYIHSSNDYYVLAYACPLNSSRAFKN